MFESLGHPERIKTMREFLMGTVKSFEDNPIRSIWIEEEDEWYFSIVDVVRALTKSENPQIYWRVLKKRLKEEGNESVTICNAFKLRAVDGKMRLTDVANVEQLFRLIQSIPSPCLIFCPRKKHPNVLYGYFGFIIKKENTPTTCLYIRRLMFSDIYQLIKRSISKFL